MSYILILAPEVCDVASRADLICICLNLLQCLSSALRSEKHNPKALVMASAMMIPFQPMLVTALHTGFMEVSIGTIA